MHVGRKIPNHDTKVLLQKFKQSSHLNQTRLTTTQPRFGGINNIPKMKIQPIIDFYSIHACDCLEINIKKKTSKTVKNKLETCTASFPA